MNVARPVLHPLSAPPPNPAQPAPLESTVRLDSISTAGSHLLMMMQVYGTLPWSWIKVTGRLPVRTSELALVEPALASSVPALGYLAMLALAVGVASGEQTLPVDVETGQSVDREALAFILATEAALYLRGALAGPERHEAVRALLWHYYNEGKRTRRRWIRTDRRRDALHIDWSKRPGGDPLAAEEAA